MIRAVIVGLGALAAFASFAASAGDAPASEEGVKAFADVYRVLQSPRCVNCHPNGDVPHVGDDHHVHAMEVRRGLEQVGMSCQTCHRATATFASRQVGAPPAVPKWGLPPAETPMVFEGKSAHDLCEQMKDPAKNGGKDAAALHDHVANDAIVAYGWNPGGHRTLPPITHDAFVAAMSTWLNAGMPCP
ncbi:MAG TPA: hypothetical protein VGO62_03410 [Myxococcota bacterium]|jgi:mono/diheme cytochrome c family protein